MDAVVIKLALGFGIQTAIGWFAPVLYGITNVLPMILTLFLYADKSSEYNAAILGRKSSHGVPPDITYDFIIVGGGSSGSLLANRLSKSFKVLLLERGGEANPLTTVPGLRASLLGNPQVDYAYRTVPQNSSCLSCTNREMVFNAGIGLGGNSILNGMIYIRPSPHDFNRFASYTKDERWNYENVLPYFLRSEQLCKDCKSNPQGISAIFNPKYHGTKGELPTSSAPYAPLVSEFLEALEWGRVTRGDLNAPYYKPIGDLSTYAHENGRRVNAFQAFVEPILEDRTSLTVLKYARVMQVLFEPGTNQASGVKYERFGKIEMAKASKEVILSAGAIETPKLLMLSGIGPKRHLNELNIPVRVNLQNVGRNLQNHVGAQVGPFLIDRPLSILPDRDVNEDAAVLYLKNGTGPLSLAGPVASSLWTSTRALNSGETEWPDMQIFFTADGVGQIADQATSRRLNMRPEVMKEFYDPVKGHDAFSLSVSVGRPKSRGVIRLRSSNYMDDPVIDPRAYEDADHADIHTVVEGIQRVVYLVEHAPSFKRLGARLSPIPFPTCTDYVFQSEEYWECYARQFSIHLYHYSGTASMGPKNSPQTVVDSELRVVGTKRLRIVDASVMPYVTTTNSYATVLMIAERGADFIIDSNSKASI